MRKGADKLRRAVGVALTAVMILLIMPGEARAEARGFQTFIVVNRTATEGRVVATGVLNSTGSVAAPEGQRPTPFPVVMTFEQGTLFLTVDPTHNGLRFDPQSCVLAGQIFGIYEVTGGTGQLAGASGSGTFEGHVVNVFDRGADGECLGPASGQPPRQGIQVVRNAGSINLPIYGA